MQTTAEIWVIFAGNPGQFPYYLGARKPMSVCWEDGRQFSSSEEAAAYLSAHGCPGAWTPEVVRVR